MGPFPLDKPPSDDDLVEMIEELKNGLMETASGGEMPNADYVRIRKVLLGNPQIADRLPEFLKTCRSTYEFWNFIKPAFGSYAERRAFLAEAFNPLLDDLEAGDIATFHATYERLEPPLGQGGFGVVYKYLHRNLDMVFAVKVFAPAFSQGGEGNLDRFFREARILFKLQHWDIIRVYDVGMMGRRPFIRMEYFEGRALNEILRSYGRIPPDRARWLIGRLAGALRHAHDDVGVIHRDIKPSNVLVHGPTQEVRLIDFGLGVFIEHDLVSRITKTGEGVVGGFHTAPELVGDPRLLDKRSDIYSLGALWYEMVVGRPPAGADIAAGLREVDGVAEVDVSLILSCLQDLERRCSSAAELLDALGGSHG